MTDRFLSNAMKLGFGAAALACATPAMAEIPTDRCIPMAELNVMLKAEGQRTLVIGNRSSVVERDAAGKAIRFAENAEVITSNADGSVGYNLGGDRPREETSNCMRVGANLTRVRTH